MTMRRIAAGPRMARGAPALIAALLALFVSFSIGAARAQEETFGAGSVEDFSWHLQQFQKEVAGINGMVQDRAEAIDSITDVGRARAATDTMLLAVSALFSAISPNGPVSELGKKALDLVKTRLAKLPNDKRFTAEQREYLLDQWGKLQSQTQGAITDINNARQKFVNLSQNWRASEAFARELLQVEQPDKALEEIHKLVHDVRAACAELNNDVGAIKPPGMQKTGT